MGFLKEALLKSATRLKVFTKLDKTLQQLVSKGTITEAQARHIAARKSTELWGGDPRAMRSVYNAASEGNAYALPTKWKSPRHYLSERGATFTDYTPHESMVLDSIRNQKALPKPPRLTGSSDNMLRQATRNEPHAEFKKRDKASLDDWFSSAGE